MSSRGIDIDARDKDGNTVMHIACSNRDRDSISLLLACYADLCIMNNKGLTARETLVTSLS